MARDQKKPQVVDLRTSRNILKGMGQALMEQAKLSGSDPGAASWFLNKIEEGNIILPSNEQIKKSILNSRQRQSSKKYLMMEGRMFVFSYLPKGYKTLKYWDATPIVISLGFHENLLLGINLHFLPPDIRTEIVDRMLGLADGEKGLKVPAKGQGMFRITYEDLKTMKYVAGLSCLRTYDLSRIIGRVVIIPSNEWANAVSLPFTDFHVAGGAKANKEEVWIETKMKIRELMRRL